MEVDLASVITAIGGLIGAVGGVYSYWCKFHQDEKNKMTELKIEQYKKQEERRSYQRSNDSAVVFGELWRILHECEASRVYIVQPHPLKHSAFLSIQFEVKRRGLEGMKMEIQSLPMEEVAVFSKKMAENLWMCFTDIDKQVEDRRAKSLLSSHGTKAVAIKKLSSSIDWVGSIFCEFTEDMKVTEEEVHQVMHEVALNIQYNLPEYKEEEL